MNLILKRIEPAVFAIGGKEGNARAPRGGSESTGEREIRREATSWEADGEKKRKTMVRTLISDNERLGVGKERKREEEPGDDTRFKQRRDPKRRERSQACTVSPSFGCLGLRCENPWMTGVTTGKRIHSPTRAYFLFGPTSRLFTPDSGVRANQQQPLSRCPPRFVDAINWLQFNRFPTSQSALLRPRTVFLVTRVITKSKHTTEAELTGKTPMARS